VAEVADPVEQPLQVRLVDHRPGNGGLAVSSPQAHASNAIGNQWLSSPRTMIWYSSVA
jgi:hypothetical protein